MHLRWTFAVLVVCAYRQVEAQSATLYTNNTMDDQFVWFEKGVYPDNPSTGLPHAGLIAGTTDPQSTFLMQPYTSNNVLLVQAPSNPVPGVQSGTMTLVTPTPATSLAIATSSGFGPNVVQVTVHFADGYQDAVGTITSPDWETNSTPIVTFCAGRFRVYNSNLTLANGSISNPADFDVSPNPNLDYGPRIKEVIFAMTTVGVHPVGAVDFQFVSSNPFNPPSGKAAIFGISTGLSPTGPFTAAELTPSSFNGDVVIEAVPEPGAVGLIGLAAGVGLRRRRRASR